MSSIILSRWYNQCMPFPHLWCFLPSSKFLSTSSHLVSCIEVHPDAFYIWEIEFSTESNFFFQSVLVLFLLCSVHDYYSRYCFRCPWLASNPKSQGQLELFLILLLPECVLPDMYHHIWFMWCFRIEPLCMLDNQATSLVFKSLIYCSLLICVGGTRSWNQETNSSSERSHKSSDLRRQI